MRQDAPGTPTAVVPNSVDVEYFSAGGERAGRGADRLHRPAHLPAQPRRGAPSRRRHPAPHPRATPWRHAHHRRRRPALGPRHPAATRRYRDRLGHRRASVTSRRASVVVAPLRIGSGTRLKVVEGLAMAKPMVSTSVGCEGIDVTLRRAPLRGRRRRTTSRTPSCCCSRDRSLGHRLGAAGHRLARDHYSWRAPAGRLAELYDRLTRADPVRGGHTK